LLTLPSTPSSKTQAFLSDIKGSVKIRAANKSETVIKDTEFAFLHDGDTVYLGDDGEAVFWQAYSKILPLKPKTSKKINKAVPSLEAGVLSFDEYLKCESLALKAYNDIKRSSPRKQSITEQYFIALSPRFSKVVDNRPVFEWTPLPNASSYDFQLIDLGQEEKSIWKKNTKEARLTYPDYSSDKSIKELKPGKYKWEIIANLDQNIRKYDAADFEITDTAESKKIRTALASAGRFVDITNATNLVYIAVCFEYQQYPEAEKVLRAALQRNPNDQMLKALLLQAYEDMRRPDEREDLRQPFKDMNEIEVYRKVRLEGLVQKR
jgi:hypothetical protein